jgi:hypothetical protein
MRPLSDRAGLILLLFFLLPAVNKAQEGAWTFSLSGGFRAPSLSAVNETLDKTIRDWNVIQEVPITPMDHFSLAPSIGFRCSYRYDREMSVSFSGSYFKQSLNASYRDNSVYLNLDRSVEATSLMLGLSHYLSPLSYDMEISIFIDVGLMFARAGAVSYNSREEKSGNSTVTVIFFDSDAIYRKTKLVADGGALWTWTVAQPFFLKGEVSYRFGKIGMMDGEVRRLQGTFPEQSVAEFDFSGFSATVGVGITF